MKSLIQMKQRKSQTSFKILDLKKRGPGLTKLRYHKPNTEEERKSTNLARESLLTCLLKLATLGVRSRTSSSSS